MEKKLELLASLVKDKVDILLASETKLDETFPLNQFTIDGYSEPIRVDRNCHGGGLVFSIRDDLERIFNELTLRKAKWLLMGGYNHHKSSISYFLGNASKQLDNFLPTYENMLILGDFEFSHFCELYNLKHLINGPTCYMNAENPSS